MDSFLLRVRRKLASQHDPFEWSLKCVLASLEIKTEQLVYFDIGCHKAEWAKSLRRAFPKASGHLFDPVSYPETLAFCNQSINKSTYHKVAFFSDSSERFFYSNGTSGDSLFQELTPSYAKVKPVLIPTTSIDRYIYDHNISLPHILKIDAQGAELEIIRGAENLLSRPQTVFIELEVSFYEYNKEAPLAHEVIFAMDQLGYKLISLTPIHEGLHVLNQSDALFVKKDSLTQASCAGLDLNAISNTWLTSSSDR